MGPVVFWCFLPVKLQSCGAQEQRGATTPLPCLKAPFSPQKPSWELHSWGELEWPAQGAGCSLPGMMYWGGSAWLSQDLCHHQRSEPAPALGLTLPGLPPYEGVGEVRLGDFCAYWPAQVSCPAWLVFLPYFLSYPSLRYFKSPSLEHAIQSWLE